MKNKKKIFKINNFYRSLNDLKKFRPLKKALKRVVKDSFKKNQNLDVEYELYTSKLLNRYAHLYDDVTCLINY